MVYGGSDEGQGHGGIKVKGEMKADGELIMVGIVAIFCSQPLSPFKFIPSCPPSHPQLLFKHIPAPSILCYSVDGSQAFDVEGVMKDSRRGG